MSYSNIYEKKKRRVLGELMVEGELKTSKSWCYIHKSSKEDLMTYESKGLVVAISGSGNLPLDHQQSREASALAKAITEKGGIILNGGRSTGIMEATSRAAGENFVGILFPEIEKEFGKVGVKVLVNSPQPRIELLSTCAPSIVIFRGGLGTLMILMRAIVHIRNRKFHPEQLPQLVFVSNYWIGLLTTMMNLGCLPGEFLKELIFFDNSQQIISKLPKV